VFKCCWRADTIDVHNGRSTSDDDDDDDDDDDMADDKDSVTDCK